MEVNDLNRVSEIVNGESTLFIDLTPDEVLLLDIEDRLQYELWSKQYLINELRALRYIVFDLEERMKNYEQRNNRFIETIANGVKQCLEPTYEGRRY